MLLFATIPFFQRHFLYLHKANTLFWHDIDKPEPWGFAQNQVTPFKLPTSDGESLYAWHILPLPLYGKHEEDIASSREPGFCEKVTDTAAFRLLRDDPDAKVLLYFHGNAGHVANGWRPDTYHALTDATSYHVITVDYRGFGKSTGTPSEKGLILDGMALVDWAINVAGVPPERIVLYGQSLGTAVVSGVAEVCAVDGIEFSGIVLVAGFSNLPAMLTGYRISGYVPIFGPFLWLPFMSRWLQRFVYEKWQSDGRLAHVVKLTKSRLRLSFVHGKNDMDIPCLESDKLFRAAAMPTVTGDPEEVDFESIKAGKTVKRGEDGFVTTWVAEPNIIIRQEQSPHGAHNPIMGYAPTLLAVMRSFEQD